MKKNKIIAIIKNELKLASKDKLNALFVYILPVLIVPVLTILFSLIAYSEYKADYLKTKDTKYNIGINFEKDKVFEDIIENETNDFDIKIINLNTKDLKDKFKANKIDAYIEKIEKDGREEYKIYHNNYSIEEDLEDVLKKYKVGKILEENNINNSELSKIKVSEEFVTDANILESIGVSNIIITLLMFTIFFAIFVMGLSTIAQEKEKHTLETLLSFPLSVKEVMLGKYLSLVIQALKAVVLCSLSTVLTCFISFKIIHVGVISDTLKNSFPNLFLFFIILLIVGTILVFLFSYLIIFFTSEADTYKKADYQMINIAIVIIIALAVKELVNLNSLYSAFIPFVNLYGVMNQLFNGNINLLYYIISIISSIAYIIFFTSIYINDADIEKILFGKIETKKKINQIKIKSNYVGIKKSIILLAVGMILSIILSLAFSFNEVLGISTTQFSLLVTFVFGYKLSNVKLKDQISFKKVNFISIISYLTIFISIFIFGNLATNLITVGTNADTSTVEYIIDFIREYKLLSIFIVALLPAVIEEIVFRGVIQYNFNKKYNIVFSILVSSLLFGIAHMNLFQFIFTFILGIFLGYVYYDSKNIIVPILFHFTNNLLAVIINMSGIKINANSSFILLIISFVTLIIGVFLTTGRTINKEKSNR